MLVGLVLLFFRLKKLRHRDLPRYSLASWDEGVSIRKDIVFSFKEQSRLGQDSGLYLCLHPRSQRFVKKNTWETSLPVQWLRLYASIAGGVGFIPGQGTKILHTKWPNQKKKRREKYMWHNEPHSKESNIPRLEFLISAKQHVICMC